MIEISAALLLGAAVAVVLGLAVLHLLSRRTRAREKALREWIDRSNAHSLTRATRGVAAAVDALPGALCGLEKSMAGVADAVSELGDRHG